MSRLQALRGMQDFFELQASRMNAIRDIAFDVSRRFGFLEISTPILESSELFRRTVGEASDIVSKEMFEFTDLDETSVCLRPEGTAGVARAAMSNKITGPQRYAYCGPMFRRERPQKGRHRQFHQFGVELLGSNHVNTDIDVISLASMFLNDLKLTTPISLLMNTIGDQESRKSYNQSLQKYFIMHASSLSETSQQRLKTGNCLRILDSKLDNDKEIVANAPRLLDFISPQARKRFDTVLQGLELLNISYQLDTTLVRGLDYYNDTVWEFVSNDIGSQSTVLAGGRYDSLFSTLGASQPVAAIGWAAGLERLDLLRNPDNLPSRYDIAIIDRSSDDSNRTTLVCMQLCQQLRQQGQSVYFCPEIQFSKQLKAASSLGAKLAVFVGEREMTLGHLTLKDLASGVQKVHALNNGLDVPEAVAVILEEATGKKSV